MKVAVLGCGTIGRGVVEILRNGVTDIELVRILDRTECFISEFYDLFTDNVDDIINDESIDAVVETMGGRGFSYSCVKKALESGKSVVTANKELISYHLKELTDLANSKGVYLLYEASVGGGIPFIKTLSNLAEFNVTESIVGILNGTTNYILTKMQKDDMSYDDALAEAKKLGFAEANPTADVEGHDLVRKIAILSMLSYNQEINPDDVYAFGVSGVKKQFIDFVNNLGYVLKYVCFSSLSQDGKSVEIGVEPALVNQNGVIGNINYENNFVTFKMKPNDGITFIGKGAGRMPTATAVVSDLKVIRDKGQNIIFSNTGVRKVELSDRLVNAVVEKDGEIKFLKNVKASEVRNSNFDFYAIEYKD